MMRAYGWKATAGPVDPPGLLEEFRHSVIEEKIAKEQRSKDSRLSISNGEQIHSGKSKFVYRFLFEQEFYIDDDTPVDIYIEDHKVLGEVVSSDIDSINIAFEQDLGKTIRQAVLIKSDTKLLEKQIARLDTVKKMETGFNHEGCRKLFGFVQPQDHTIFSESADYSEYIPEPNQEQINAVKHAFSQEVTFIWGPPGTGKTKTLGIILNKFVKQGKSVLLVSHTNVAVDELLIKFASIESSKPFIEAGRILRVGTPAKDDMILDRMGEDYIIQKAEPGILERIKKIDHDEGELGQSLEKLSKSRIDQNIADYEEIQREIEGITSNNSRNEGEIARAKKLVLEYAQKIRMLQEELVQRKNASLLERLFSGDSVKSLTEQLDRLEQLKIISCEHIEALNSRKKDLECRQNDLKTALESKKTALETEIKECDIPVPSRFSLGSIKELHENIRATIHTLKNEHELLSRKIEDRRVKLRSNALIVACTLTKAFTAPQVFSRHYSTFILDEASMAPLPLVYLAAGLVSPDSNHYIVAGDFRQLPPIAISKEPSAEKWLRRDIFNQAGIVRSVDSRKTDERLVMLREQHRMHPEIVQLINASMYQGLLTSGPEVLAEKREITTLSPFENHSLILIDTSTVNPWANWTHNKSRINLYTSMLASRLAQSIMGQKNCIESLGIITPYAAQAKLISTQLAEAKIPRRRAVAATVHRFQGNEQDCILLDLVDGPPHEKVGQIIKGNFVDSDAGKLINVAVSRAKGKLIVIAHVKYLLNFKWSHLNDNDAIIRVIRAIQKTGLVIDSAKLLPSFLDAHDLPAARSGLILPDENTLSIWNECNFYSLFLQDIQNARSRVVIFSPFLGKTRLASLMDTFRRVKDKGVRFFIITRQAQHQSYNPEVATMLINELVEAGFDVILAGNNTEIHEMFHEKLALIDDTSFYHGSLNILSHHESSDSMMVYRSPKLIGQLVKYFNIEQVIRKYEYRKNADRTKR